MQAAWRHDLTAGVAGHLLPREVRRPVVRGRSTRDGAGLAAEGSGAVSKNAASRAAQARQAEFDAWRSRNRGAWNIRTANLRYEHGTMVLRPRGLGPRERRDVAVVFRRDLTARTLPPRSS
jgi:hypothetical protein